MSLKCLLCFALQGVLAVVASAALAADAAATPVVSRDKDDGYRGIWFTLGQFSEHGDKYSGGLGTYTANHVPMAIYSPQVKKTFFVYGGAKQGQRYLLVMASYYDHERHTVPRPTIVHDKGGVDDPHDNPSLCLDEQGYVWVFVSGRGRHRPGFIYRSLQPYSVDGFEQRAQRELTYPQPRWIEGRGFLHLFTKYTKGRELYWSTDDMGQTWRNVAGDPLTLPLAEAQNPALVRDYQAEKRLVYIHDLDLDRHGRPVILYITSADYKPGPSGDPRWWTVARATADGWEFTEVTRANHNYTTGSLYLEDDGTWRIIGPTEPGPQPIGSGAEVAVWPSRDEGKTWRKDRDATARSPRNHNYVRRPVHAHPDFYAFWADGDPDKLSPSQLYFANQAGDRVWRLPYDMADVVAAPEAVEQGK